MFELELSSAWALKYFCMNFKKMVVEVLLIVTKVVFRFLTHDINILIQTPEIFVMYLQWNDFLSVGTKQKF